MVSSVIAVCNVLGYKGKWGLLSQPRKLGDGPDLWLTPSTTYCSNQPNRTPLLAKKHVSGNEKKRKMRIYSSNPLQRISTATGLQEGSKSSLGKSRA